jgi:hypothetical protein
MTCGLSDVMSRIYNNCVWGEQKLRPIEKIDQIQLNWFDLFDFGIILIFDLFGFWSKLFATEPTNNWTKYII